MSSLLWTSVFVFLTLEVALLVVMLLPLSSRLMRPLMQVIRRAFQYKQALIFVLLILVVAFAESVRTQVFVKEAEPDDLVGRSVVLSGFAPPRSHPKPLQSPAQHVPLGVRDRLPLCHLAR